LNKNLSNHYLAGVDNKRLSCNGTGFIGAQKHHSIGDVLAFYFAI
jgi:hypothetical protein